MARLHQVCSLYGRRLHEHQRSIYLLILTYLTVQVFLCTLKKLWYLIENFSLEYFTRHLIISKQLGWTLNSPFISTQQNLHDLFGSLELFWLQKQTFQCELN